MVHEAGRYKDRQFGNYHLIQRIGAGAFAEVYLGRHIHLDTLAAVKVLTATLTEEEIGRFRDEARTVRSLKHPHILSVLDFGMEGHIPFIVMDYAPNGTLRQRHFRNTRIPLPAIVSYVKQVAAALQYVHGQKLIHRDIKPENLLIGANNEILLSDFGIAADVHSSLTQRVHKMQDIAGTVYYMAPEQIAGEPRPASDQYALGIVVYEWLTGAPPFMGKYEEVIARHISATPPSLQRAGITLPLDVEEVVMTTLTKDYRQRFSSVEAFARALEEALISSITLTPARLPVPPSYVSTYDGHTAPVWTVAWSPDQTHIASAGQDRTVQVWDIKTGHCQLTYTEHASLVWNVAWSADGSLIASAGDDDSVKIWQAQSGRLIYSQHQNAPDRLWAMSWSGDNAHIATANNDGIIQVWNTHNGQHTVTYREHSARVHALAWSPDGSLVASADYDGTVQIWHAWTGQRRLVYRGHVHTPIYAIAWSPDGTRLASADYGGSVQVWNSLDGRPLHTYRGHAAAVYSVAWSPNGKFIASASDDRTVQVWQAQSGNIVFTYRKHSAPVRSAAWSSNGVLIASGALDGSVHVWQVG
jgi:eukaryotic-like serine/threonine-protein kinase